MKTDRDWRPFYSSFTLSCETCGLETANGERCFFESSGGRLVRHEACHVLVEKNEGNRAMSSQVSAEEVQRVREINAALDLRGVKMRCTEQEICNFVAIDEEWHDDPVAPKPLQAACIQCARKFDVATALCDRDWNGPYCSGRCVAMRREVDFVAAQMTISINGINRPSPIVINPDPNPYRDPYYPHNIACDKLVAAQTYDHPANVRARKVAQLRQEMDRPVPHPPEGRSERALPSKNGAR